MACEHGTPCEHGRFVNMDGGFRVVVHHTQTPSIALLCHLCPAQPPQSAQQAMFNWADGAVLRRGSCALQAFCAFPIACLPPLRRI